MPEKLPKIKLPDVKLKPHGTLFDLSVRKYLGTYPIPSRRPLTFEALNQSSGFVLYETMLPKTRRDPTPLKFEQICDRGLVFVNKTFMGIVSRSNNIDTLSIGASSGVRQLSVLVENQGRNTGNDHYFKGILEDVLFDKQFVMNWLNYKITLNDPYKIKNVVKRHRIFARKFKGSLRVFRNIPTFFHGEFEVKKNQILDTYLDTSGWGKVSCFFL